MEYVYLMIMKWAIYASSLLALGSLPHSSAITHKGTLWRLEPRTVPKAPTFTGPQDAKVNWWRRNHYNFITIRRHLPYLKVPYPKVTKMVQPLKDNSISTILLLPSK